MLNSLKQTGRNIGREIIRASENLSEGWRERLSRSCGVKSIQVS